MICINRQDYTPYQTRDLLRPISGRLTVSKIYISQHHINNFLRETTIPTSLPIH